MEEEQQGRAVGSVRAWEIAVAALFLAFAAVVVWESRRLGSQWGSDGPQAGYFPFYIGAIILVASVVNLVTAVLSGAPGRAPFVYWGQMKMILTVMIPSFVYVALIANPWFGLGIYVASAIFIALFMAYLGRYGWAKTAAVSVGTMLVFFIMFEVWFKVPLPKGPLETAFGFN
jgi:putative tricarboxylic transport membrane protein